MQLQMKREIYLYLYAREKSGNDIPLYQSFKKQLFSLQPVLSRASIVTRNMTFLGVLLCACVQFTFQSSIRGPVRVEEPAIVNKSREVEREATGTPREIRSSSTSRKTKRGSSQVSDTCIFPLYHYQFDAEPN